MLLYFSGFSGSQECLAAVEDIIKDASGKDVNPRVMIGFPYLYNPNPPTPVHLFEKHHAAWDRYLRSKQGKQT